MSHSASSAAAAEIRAALGRQRRSQRWLSIETGIHPSTLARRLSGTRSLTVDEVDAIARVLAVPVAVLLGGDVAA